MYIKIGLTEIIASQLGAIAKQAQSASFLICVCEGKHSE